MSREDHPSGSSGQRVDAFLAGDGGRFYIELGTIAVQAFVAYSWEWSGNRCRVAGARGVLFRTVKDGDNYGIASVLPEGYWDDLKTSSFSRLTDEEREALHRRESEGG